MQEKREKFPRFYFLGDDDLLEILGQSTNPTVIQSHLKKLFQGIHKVEFDEANKHIVAMVSLEGEVVPLKSPVKVTLDVEVLLPPVSTTYTVSAYCKSRSLILEMSCFETWLADLATEMKKTLSQLVVQCVQSASGGLDPGKYPSQV